ncbi:MAG: response regulator transcription factor [Burkholderiales bacterium]|nr:response regulator transcription factor [Burkholderiales bacterium]
MTPRVLVIEDDVAIAGNLVAYLESHDFAVDIAYDGHCAQQRLDAQTFDLILLDMGLPRADGAQVLRHLRQVLALSTPVLVLSARDQLNDKLAGFASGADDYLTKPFALAEVEARARALVKRAEGSVTAAARHFGPLTFDPRTRRLTAHDRPVHLTRKTSRIVEILLRDPGRVMQREVLEAAVWGDDPPESDALRGQIHLLRKALAEAGYDGVETVHGVGYRLRDTTRS